MLLAHLALDDGPDGVDDVRGRKVVSAGEQRPPRLLRAPAPGVHVGGALGAQSRAGDGVDDIVDAGVPGHAAAEHGRIGGVDDGAGAQRGEVAPPQGDPLPQRSARAAGARQGRQLERVGGAGGAHALGRLGGEQGVEVLAVVIAGPRPAAARLLRPFTLTTLLHPLLRPFFSYTGG